MTRRQALDAARELLAVQKIADASLEAELLLRHALEIDRTQLYTEPDCALTPRQEETYRSCIERRIKGEPSAYITGHREFFGLDFYVDKNVLIPRPETELLVEQAVTRASKHPHPAIVDVGTGCGAIAISLATHIPHAKIYATDISPAALEVASRNCQKHRVEDRITLLTGNLLIPVPVMADIIVANLPYVTTADLPQVNTSGFEPSLALHGGWDGLDLINRLCLQARDRLSFGGCLLLEIGPGQGKKLADFLRKIYSSANIDLLFDLNGLERVVCLTLSLHFKEI
ncbi:MAG: peptide chain release factor N(5)-glutamine methyltransferase [Dehalococcoidales bacterium]|nr:peptide chain release factor N(5)-glutamine methyltransferase [Dehalococcoidales bacterium]